MTKRGVFLVFKKLGMILFTFGVLISLFSGVFDFVHGFNEAKIPIIVILGVFVGLMNISDNERMNFLISSAVFIVAAGVIVDFSPGRLVFLEGLFEILYNLAIFVAAAAIVVSLKMVFEFLSEYDPKSVSALPSPDERKHMENVWDVVVFVAVAMVIVVLVLESFFALTPELIDILQLADYVIIMVFVVDLFVLYNKNRDLKNFVKTSWLDMIAVIPLSSAFRLTKLVRGTRIIRIFTRTHHATTRINRTAKYFSDESGFNKIMNKKKAPASKKSSSKSSSKTKKKTTSSKRQNSTRRKK